MLVLGRWVMSVGPLWSAPVLSFSIEIDQKLQEIMKQTGYLTIGGQVLPPCRHPGGCARTQAG